MKKNKKLTNLWFLSISILTFVIMILLFLIIGFNINDTKVYTFSGGGEYISFNNGLIVTTPKTTIINISNFREGNFDEKIKKITIDLYIGNKKVYSYGKEDNNGMLLKDVIKDDSIYIENYDLKKEVLNNLENNCYIKIYIVSYDNKTLKENILFDMYKH